MLEYLGGICPSFKIFRILVLGRCDQEGLVLECRTLLIFSQRGITGRLSSASNTSNHLFPRQSILSSVSFLLTHIISKSARLNLHHFI